MVFVFGHQWVLTKPITWPKMFKELMVGDFCGILRNLGALVVNSLVEKDSVLLVRPHP